MRRIKSWVARFLPLLCFVLLTALAISAAARLHRSYRAVSLRFEETIPHETAFAAKEYAADAAQKQEQGERALWPTFWTQQTARFKTDLASFEANTLYFDGDASLVWPGRYRSGHAPGALDESGCAVSSHLAWQLWGGTDVVGLPLEIDGVPYTVRGVFEEDTPFALVGTGGAPFAGGWQNVELAGGLKSDRRAEAEAFVQNAGLGTPRSIVNGGAVQAAGRGLALLPTVLLALGCAAAWVWQRRHRFFLPAPVLLFLVCLAFALGLPALLSLFPAWAIPAQWSNFTFWAALARQTGQRAQEWFLLVPTLRDAHAKTAALTLLLCGACSAMLLPHLWRQAARRTAPKPLAPAATYAPPCACPIPALPAGSAPDGTPTATGQRTLPPKTPPHPGT